MWLDLLLCIATALLIHACLQAVGLTYLALGLNWDGVLLTIAMWAAVVYFTGLVVTVVVVRWRRRTQR